MSETFSKEFLIIGYSMLLVFYVHRKMAVDNRTNIYNVFKVFSYYNRYLRIKITENTSLKFCPYTS